MTVFVAQQDDRKNLKAASRFGELKFIFTRGVFPDNQQERTAEMLRIARRVLKDFNPEHDYIVPIGDPVSIALIAAVVSETWEVLPLLKWDGENEAYYPVIIDLREPR